MLTSHTDSIQFRSLFIWQVKVYAERGLFLYNMEIVDAQCDYMQTVQKASVQLMLIIINFVPGTKDTLKLDQVNSANLLSMF